MSVRFYFEKKERLISYISLLQEIKTSAHLNIRLGLMIFQEASIRAVTIAICYC